jgi:hypothetical protein
LSYQTAPFPDVRGDVVSVQDVISWSVYDLGYLELAQSVPQAACWLAWAGWLWRALERPGRAVPVGQQLA